MAPSAVPVAGDADRARLSAQKDALFQQMLRDPANLDVAFRYADISAQLGDNEAAISTLERMLLFNPNLPRVDLELGALYFRLGSFEVAQTYFDKAAASRPPADVQTRIDQYRAQIANQESPSHLTGYLLFGGQYQSDANVAPGSPLIHSPIGDVLLNNQFVKQSDGNFFATAAALYSYDLGTQNRDALEVSGTGFVNHYLHVNRLDLDLAEVTAGPRFNFPDLGIPGVSSASVKPYVILNEVGLGENQYFNTYGAGVESTVTVLNDLALKGAFEFRQKNFSNALDRPDTRGLNGNDKLVTLLATKPVTDNSALSLELDFLDQSTRFNFYSNKAYAISGGYRIAYDDPTRFLNLPWSTTFYLGRTFDNYSAPDPCCNTSGSSVFFSGSDRYDRRWRYGLTQDIAIRNNISVVVQLERDVVSSNLSLYAYTSNSVLVGPQIRF